MNHYGSYLATWTGRELLKKHTLSTVGRWQVLGEDENCDLGGYHHQPELGTFFGRLDDVIKIAVELPNFWSWGGGGAIIFLEKDDVVRFLDDGIREAALAKLTDEEKKVLGLA